MVNLALVRGHMQDASPDWSIAQARPEHVPAIASIAADYVLNRMARERASQEGFLVSAFEEKDYRRFLSGSDHYYVAVQVDEVVGFLLGFSRDRVPESDWVGTRMKGRDPRDFVLIKQVCVKRGNAGRGVARGLYRHVINGVPDRPVLAAVVLDPPNDRSVRLLEKLGFGNIWEVTPPDGFPRGVWLREPGAG